MKMKKTISYVTCYAKDFGKGHFSEEEFETLEEAEQEIMRTAEAGSLESNGYWRKIAENMSIIKRTTFDKKINASGSK